jgi:hypothetical protein
MIGINQRLPMGRQLTTCWQRSLGAVHGDGSTTRRSPVPAKQLQDGQPETLGGTPGAFGFPRTEGTTEFSTPGRRRTSDG